MASAKKPMVNVYEEDENGEEQLVYRKMTDEEHEAWKRQIADAPTLPEDEPHSLLTQVETMTDEEKQQLRDLLNG